MTTCYLPVVTKGGDEKYHFWNEHCCFHYNRILVSPFTTGWIKRRDFCSNKNLKIYADSGGYQILTLHLKVHALDVLRWQERIADIGFTLDIPPHYYSNYSSEQFLKCMGQSNKNADLMYRFKIKDDMRLFGVIQGKNSEECNAWYTDLIRDHEYDGYCLVLSIHKSTTGLPWIEQLEFAKAIKKPIHFLGSNKRLFVLILTRLSHLTGIDYTYDSSTLSIGARYGKYIEPRTWKHLSFSKNERKRKKMEVPSCNCPVCIKHSPRDLIRNPELINLHNLFVITSFNDTANKLSDEQFILLLKNQVKNELQMKQIIDLLEISKNYKNMENYFDNREKK